MSSYKEPKNKGNIQLEDEIISDWKYFTGQQNYSGVQKKNDKTIRILKLKFFLKDISDSFAYWQYIKQISCPFSKTRCKYFMEYLRTKPCLCCFNCKHLGTESCSELICTNPSSDVLVDPWPLGMWC